MTQGRIIHFAFLDSMEMLSFCISFAALYSFVPTVSTHAETAGFRHCHTTPNDLILFWLLHFSLPLKLIKDVTQKGFFFLLQWL